MNINELKERAMSRPRRVIFDNDGSDRGKLCRGTTPDDLIDVRAKPAIDAGIDTYMYTTGWGFGIGLHDSTVGSVLATTEGHLAGNLVGEYLRQGTDCLRIQSEYARRRGVEFFWGMRMNDTHDQGYGGVFMPENRFKNENPDVMFGEGVKHGAVTAVDYLDERVRDFGVAYIMDVVDRYDIDGIFLDFFRHPIFFRSNASGRPATAVEIDAMTSFMRRVKNELDSRSADAGKYYLTSVRVPDSVKYSEAIGLEIETWLAEGLADILFTTSYLRFNDWTYSAELGHKYGVPVYPSLDETRVRSEYARHKRNSLAGYYGRIMEVWDAGCDGVLMFNNSGLREAGASIEQNWFAEDSGRFPDGLAATVKGPEYVNTLDKTYFGSFRGVGAVAGGALPHEEYINIPTLNHRSPVFVAAGGSADIPLRISDDPAAATRAGHEPRAKVTAIVNGTPTSVHMSLHGTEVHLTTAENENEYLLTADLPAALLRTGPNIFTFRADADVQVLDLWVDITY